MNPDEAAPSSHPTDDGIPASMIPPCRPSQQQAQAGSTDEKPASPRDRHETTKNENKKTTKFRFKSESRRRPRSRPRSRREDGDGDDDTSSHPRRRRQRDNTNDNDHHRHHHERHHHGRRRRHRRSRRSASPAGAAAMSAADENDAFATAGPEGALSPDAAFRESLFDAMADDEGAAYWEGVYGQPIHIYGRGRRSRDGDNDNNNDKDGKVGDRDDGDELQRMTDDEYATFVRRRMWEKTHAGLLEEKARRERERAARAAAEAEAARIAEEMERSLRRGEERRRRRDWARRWGEYVAAWAGWTGDVEALPWPTTSAGREEVAAEGAVREFFVRGLGLEELGEKEFAARLKEERVRWHPDKVQQRLGGEVDGGVLRDVTAIFQIIDRLWSDTRSN
ncbi:hypothetical protein QBC33DRAFT_544019 [Phialemonium atrogriseum]|uniref:J domain-containing protein n=1 Tax=Phialemonium atrogriseum TaxID=1093897 RepID=A0AAJ0C163_9PEZI|nr:uncharacterized protein QBC33DRAFT_544019 [Phialemonium atrogriseum]KAK1765801.1 hypothetical protein QBC33DRAFT_544019 [Phialemonium atrogriseum]